MVKITLLNYIIMSLFIQDNNTLYADVHQSYDNSMRSSNDYLFVDQFFLSITYRFSFGFFMRRHKYFREDLHGHNYLFIVFC